TGLSLKQWAGFVNSAGIEMEEYLAQLGKVVDLARRNEAAPAEEIPSEQLQKDKKIIENMQFRTRPVRPIISRLPRLSQVLDSILEPKSKDDLLKPLLAPILEIRNRITQLGGHVGWLSDHI